MTLVRGREPNVVLDAGPGMWHWTANDGVLGHVHAVTGVHTTYTGVTEPDADVFFETLASPPPYVVARQAPLPADVHGTLALVFLTNCQPPTPCIATCYVGPADGGYRLLLMLKTLALGEVVVVNAFTRLHGPDGTWVERTVDALNEEEENTTP